mgnify:CR=1 FL=1
MKQYPKNKLLYYTSECQIQLTINAIRFMLSRESPTIVVKRSKIREFMSEWKTRIDKSVWAPHNCTSYYQQGSPDNRPWGLWPGTTTEYFLRTRRLNDESFEFQ